ncbi:MAG: hypothetical protein ACRETN_00750 [Nevskiales bacterium]
MSLSWIRMLILHASGDESRKGCWTLKAKRARRLLAAPAALLGAYYFFFFFLAFFFAAITFLLCCVSRGRQEFTRKDHRPTLIMSPIRAR